MSPSGAFRNGSIPTVLLVHGAFADGSIWAGVIPELQGAGIGSSPWRIRCAPLRPTLPMSPASRRRSTGPLSLLGSARTGACFAPHSQFPGRSPSPVAPRISSELRRR